MKKRRRKKIGRVRLDKAEVKRVREYCDEMKEKEAAGKFKRLWGQSKERYEGDIVIGSLGHFGAAKWFGAKWVPQYKPDGGYDLGEAQVRSTHHEPTGKTCFLIGHREKERRDQINILVQFDMNTNLAKIVGWHFGYFVKQKKNYGDHFQRGRPCFAVHHNTLN